MLVGHGLERGDQRRCRTFLAQQQPRPWYWRERHRDLQLGIIGAAGALTLNGTDTLYGRYWGCTEDVPFLHFELCYYQAIDAAIARGLSTVEAGAQGEHKLARGYEPTPTWSAHYIPDPAFRRAVADFLAREREAVAADRDCLAEMVPFRKA
jgi:predicted N-acyltransferase